MGKRMTRVEEEVSTLKEILLTVTASEERKKNESVQRPETVQKQEINRAENPQITMRESPTKIHWTPERIPDKTEK